MTTSSLPENFSITSSNDITFTTDTVDLNGLTMDTITISAPSGSANTVTLDSSYSYPTITIGSGISSIGAVGAGGMSNAYVSNNGASSSYNYTISGIDSFITQTEWVDCFPEWSRIEKMCEEYPGLKIAFENFKTIYSLVKDDYDAPPDKRIRP